MIQVHILHTYTHVHNVSKVSTNSSELPVNHTQSSVLHYWMQRASGSHCRGWCECTVSVGRRGRRWRGELGCLENLGPVGSLTVGPPDPNHCLSYCRMHWMRQRDRDSEKRNNDTRQTQPQLCIISDFSFIFFFAYTHLLMSQWAWSWTRM